jgi:hypothetical protein
VCLTVIVCLGYEAIRSWGCHKSNPWWVGCDHEASKVVPSLMPVVPSLDKVQREKKKMMMMMMMTTTMMTPDKREDMFGIGPKQKRMFFFKGFIALVDGLSTEYPHKDLVWKKD